jgi:hypothetical protein
VIKEDTKENKDTSVASTALTRSNTVSSIATIQLGTGISLAPIKKGSKTKAVQPSSKLMKLKSEKFSQWFNFYNLLVITPPPQEVKKGNRKVQYYIG